MHWNKQETATKLSIQFLHDTNGIVATSSIKYWLNDAKQCLRPALYIELQNNLQTDYVFSEKWYCTGKRE
jgi:hypothetical protein